VVQEAIWNLVRHIAWWDIPGHVTGVPVCALMGGHFGEGIRLSLAISQVAPDQPAIEAS
jgi:L-alanine-DL-glutamate epimerase-like enolase superfamily enzyme